MIRKNIFDGDSYYVQFAQKIYERYKSREWFTTNYATNIPYDSEVNEDVLKKVTPVITYREVRRYTEIYVCM